MFEETLIREFLIESIHPFRVKDRFYLWIKNFKEYCELNICEYEILQHILFNKESFEYLVNKYGSEKIEEFFILINNLQKNLLQNRNEKTLPKIILKQAIIDLSQDKKVKKRQLNHLENLFNITLKEQAIRGDFFKIIFKVGTLDNKTKSSILEIKDHFSSEYKIINFVFIVDITDFNIGYSDVRFLNEHRISISLRLSTSLLTRKNLSKLLQLLEKHQESQFFEIIFRDFKHEAYKKLRLLIDDVKNLAENEQDSKYLFEFLENSKLLRRKISFCFDYVNKNFTNNVLAFYESTIYTNAIHNYHDFPIVTIDNIYEIFRNHQRKSKYYDVSTNFIIDNKGNLKLDWFYHGKGTCHFHDDYNSWLNEIKKSIVEQGTLMPFIGTKNIQFNNKNLELGIFMFAAINDKEQKKKISQVNLENKTYDIEFLNFRG